MAKANILDNNNKLKLGIFSANCSGGLAVTKVAERWQNSWENNLALAKMCDDAGLEFLLPIARWIGYGGDTDFHGGVLETVTWAGGLLAHTKNIQVFATVHTAFNHPVVTAKQLATIDHIGNGRVGLNVVAGWNKPEYDAFGIDLPDSHPERYARAQEWYDIAKKLWTEKPAFDWDGEYFQLQKVYSNPHPYRHTFLLSMQPHPQRAENLRSTMQTTYSHRCLILTTLAPWCKTFMARLNSATVTSA